jgi:hypothetical protein
MRLTLCLPGLLLPRQALLDTAGDLELPALSRLLGHGRRTQCGGADLYGWLAQQAGLPALPAAPLRLLGADGLPGDSNWLCLDPVHLKVHRRGVTLADPRKLALDAAEDAGLRATLAPLFAGVGELVGGAPGEWHLRLAAPAALLTVALPQAAGYDVDPLHPGGDDGKAWRTLLAEAQTLLHAHPVNRAREAAGQPVINSLWPWGQGTLPAPRPLAFTAVAADDRVALGWARHCGAATTAPAAAYADGSGTVLVVLEDLAGPARDLDALRWREALTRLEGAWFAPLVAALRSRRCTALTLAGFGVDHSVELQVAPVDLWKFWRAPRALPEFAA